MNNIDVFNNTQNLIRQNKKLSLFTQNSIQQTKYLPPSFHSPNNPYYDITKISVQETLTLIPAREYADSGKKVAILNFGNPVEPGGGVTRGADAQEEYLCRASNLYNCLKSENAAPYYRLHKEIMKNNGCYDILLSTDSIIYSPNIVFFKEDVGYYPGLMSNVIQNYTYRWFNADIITCAAPFFSTTSKRIPYGDLKFIFIQRIRNIFESAIEHNVEVLILGAFGCEAFHNPPEIVASAFKEVLSESRYSHAFSDIVFAVKASEKSCPNIKAFKAAFTQSR